MRTLADRAWVEISATAAQARTGLAPRHRLALDTGSTAILAMLGLGLQFGHWPLWTAGIALGGYVSWVVAYSEASIQAARRSRLA